MDHSLSRSSERACQDNPPALLNRFDSVILLAVAGIAIAILAKDIARGALIDPDAPAHVMDGVLIHDWLLAGPQAWIAPMAFAREQYGHYPTLGIGGHYPPGFAVVEAAFFLIFGVSATTARLCVVFFGILAGAGCYVVVRFFADRATAALAAVLLLALPASTQWGRQVMLEIPLVASLLWAAVAFCWYLGKPNLLRFAVAALMALLTLLVKQSGVFLIGAMALTLCLLSCKRQVPKSHAVICLVITVVALLAVVLTLDEACLKTVSGYNTVPPWSLGSILFYPRAIRLEAGWVVVLAGLLGMVVSFPRLREHWWFLAAWALVALTMVTVTSLKAPRFAYVVLPPIAIWAAIGASQVSACLRAPALRTAALAALIAVIGHMGFRRPVADGFDFGPLVQASRAKIDQQPILFSGLRDGDFVLAVREHLPWRSSVIIRGSKLFYTCVARPDLDFVAYAHSAEAVAHTMRKFAFPHVFVERENLVGTPQDDWLRAYLRESGDYVLENSMLVRNEGGCEGTVYVDVYGLARPWQRQADYFDIPVPRTRQSIRVKLPIGDLARHSS